MRKKQGEKFSSIKKSLEIFKKAEELIPGGTQLLSRRPRQAAYGVSPMVAERAKGGYFWDVDGNKYIDTVMAVDSVILGYCDPDVDKAVIEQIKKSTTFSLLHPIEVELAEEIIRTIPCAEMVRFGKGGGEADAVAIRIARGFTGRDKVAFCGYHGWHDWYISANLESSGNLNKYLLPNVPTKGVPKCLSGTAIPFEYNNLSSLKEVLEKNKEEVACVIMEPSKTNLPVKNYLNDVKELAHKYGALLIFDEINTGFRLALGGAQEFYDVTPDMAVFGKAMANGYPLTAVVGRRDVMEVSKDMFISSTFWDDNSTIAAGLACIRKIKREKVTDHIWKMGGRYAKGWNEIVRKLGIKAELKGFPCMTSIAFNYGNKSFVNQLNTLYCQELAKEGVFGYIGYSFNISFAHKEKEVDKVLEAAERALSVVKKAIDQGSVKGYLKAEESKPLFDKRMV
ncbi:aminotransferase class III-fold pyridoxal phosphate-dependent enzyme [Candidatus Aerophobetes bacterium]|nr:aminotransferase class III-fold pyridoxal phosphate-dependent enzyme [Candidatus Aerophobetes bacterium]